MSTHTAQANRGSAPQGSHHWVMTLEVPGRMTVTQSGTWNPAPGSTRHDVFTAIRHELASRNVGLGNANVMFFALEPNQL